MAHARLVHQQGAVTRHGDEHVSCAHLLQLCRAFGDLFVGFQDPPEDFTQLMIVGLDQEGAILEHVDQQVAGGVHRDADAAAVQPGHDSLIAVAGKTLGDGAGQHQRIAGADGVELGIELLHVGLGDGGADAVDLGFLAGLDLDVDAGHALGHVDEIRVQAHLCQATFQSLPNEAGHEAQRHRGQPQRAQHVGHVDALAAELELFRLVSIDIVQLQPAGDVHDIVDRRVEGHCINHD